MRDPVRIPSTREAHITLPPGSWTNRRPELARNYPCSANHPHRDGGDGATGDNGSTHRRTLRPADGSTAGAAHSIRAHRQAPERSIAAGAGVHRPEAAIRQPLPEVRFQCPPTNQQRVRSARAPRMQHQARLRQPRNTERAWQTSTYCAATEFHCGPVTDSQRIRRRQCLVEAVNSP
jgi:hypothetical protein